MFYFLLYINFFVSIIFIILNIRLKNMMKKIYYLCMFVILSYWEKFKIYLETRRFEKEIRNKYKKLKHKKKI